MSDRSRVGNGIDYPEVFAGLRGLAAVYVLLRHCIDSLPPSSLSPLFQGDSGVRLFMIISGFSVFWLLDQKQQTFAAFITGRFFRIFPAYILALCVYAVLQSFMRRSFGLVPNAPMNVWLSPILDSAAAHFPAHLLSHLTLLQGAVPQSALPFAANALVPHGWSLTLEWQFYLLAPLLVAMAANCSRLRSAALIGLSFAALYWAGRHAPPAFLGKHLATFAIGMSGYGVYKYARTCERPGALRLYAVATVALTSILQARLCVPVIVWLVVFGVATTRDPGHLQQHLASALRWRPIASLGRMSYSVYLFHLIAIAACLRLVTWTGVPAELQYVLLPTASFVVTLPIAAIVHRLVERPCHRFGKALVDRQTRFRLAPLEPIVVSDAYQASARPA